MADGSARGNVERVEPTKAERAAARRVAESKATIPHLYVQGSLDLESSEDLMASVVHAAARALVEAPRLNSSYRDGSFELYSRVNIGVVVPEADGLVVPTIFDADRKEPAEIAAEVEELTARAKDGSITAREVAGGTFTVAGGFGYEGCAYLPVINAGQAANLGIGSPRDGVIAATLAADARMISGTAAARFLGLVQTVLTKREKPD
ncbi:MAG: 2-oxo acid dehydrogenase subunit E2 [Actinomycetota bacterium]|nr:2-oxo acid dehydrogenase subunit E2 [Actinomycetota bacterium]